MADKIRNVAIAGHSGAGKTSLAEAMLFRAGATDRLGKTAEGNTVCDFDPEEIKRKVTVASTVAPMEWKDTKINLIDTPGLFDFAAGMREGIRAAATVLIVVSGKSGVNVGTEKAYSMATEMGKCKVFFINKMDQENADFYKVIAQMKETFGNSICPMVIPYVENHKVVCYINLVTDTVFAYAADGSRKEIDSVPDGAAQVVEEMKNSLYEAIAETSDEMMDKFFAGEPFTHEEIEKGGVLTAGWLNEKYDSLNRKYFGPALSEDEYIRYEWARIPHFYRGFYVYQYATGYSAATAISGRILSEGTPARDDYIRFLKSGSSDYPVELLKIAGVDMASPQPVKLAMKTFENLVDELEKLL